LFVILLLSTAHQLRAQDEPESSAPNQRERGAYLARAADCIACHTTTGGKPYAGGLAFKLPQGTLYSPNITPDKETGIGNWSDDDFVTALQKGVGPDGTHYYPAFPYPYYTRLSRDDMLAIKGYLGTLKPVRYQPPPNDMKFPFNQRWLMVFWNWLYNPNKRFESQPQQTPEWNRGAYLTEGPGHCGACHTPLNILQGPKSGRHLGGSTIQGWHAYNITSDSVAGIGAWTNQELSEYLSTGHARGRGTASGSMAEAVTYSLRYLTSEDVNAMVTYLKTVKPVRDDKEAPTPAAANANAALAPDAGALIRKMSADTGLGARVFASACAGCHALDGTGLQTDYAELRGHRGLADPKAINVTQAVLQGSYLDTPTGRIFMPAFGRGYSNEEIASVVNFTMGWFGRRVDITAADIEKRR
jgi:mono/diheme cytochrome c family protein